MNMDEYRDQIFGVPIWGLVLSNEEYHSISYIDFLYRLKKSEPTKNKSNFSGYQTRDNLHQEGIFQEFVPNINNYANLIVDKFNERLDYKVEISSMWGNINGMAAGNFPHIHGGDISGVFYLKVPENSGNIVFVNPAVRSESHRIRIKNLSVRPDKLALFLFPSWLEHYVEPNRSDEDRISISFNISEVR